MMRWHPLHAVLALLLCSACSETQRQLTSALPQASEHEGLDDGVHMFRPSAPGGRFRLGADNPNIVGNFQIERSSLALRRSDGGLTYWSIPAHDLNYASGGSGKTSRLHVYASGGQQRFNWKNQKGFLSSPNDVRNQEFTAFVRVHGIMDAKRAMVTLKIRGGSHTDKNPSLASCTMMTFQAASTGATVRFGKELDHPLYDYVRLTPRHDATLAENRWFGLKLLSYAAAGDPTRVINQLYVDTDPFDRPSGRPRNDWKLLGEFVDVEGVSTGRYTKLADWGGWQTTVRTDGVTSLDFTLLSLREIVTPR